MTHSHQTYSPPSRPDNFPPQFQWMRDTGSTWYWFSAKPNRAAGGPVLLQCREYPELWSFEADAQRTINSWPTRPGQYWPEVLAQYTAWLLTHGEPQ